MFESELRHAVTELPPGVRVWLSRALRSGWFELGAGMYDDGPAGTRCPLAAAAMMAGVWRDGAIAPGHPSWGTPDQPAAALEEFAAYFDLLSDEADVEYSLAVVASALQGEAHAA